MLIEIQCWASQRDKRVRLPSRIQNIRDPDSYETICCVPHSCMKARNKTETTNTLYVKKFLQSSFSQSFQTEKLQPAQFARFIIRHCLRTIAHPSHKRRIEL